MSRATRADDKSTMRGDSEEKVRRSDRVLPVAPLVVLARHFIFSHSDRSG